MCEVFENEQAWNDRNTEAKETVIKQKIFMVVRTCGRNERSVIKNINQLAIDCKASSENFKIQWLQCS